MKTEWQIVLNKYQRDNLLWLLNACIGPGFVRPFTFANTGDWIGEIAWMLGELCEGDDPNITLDQLQQRVDRWLKEQSAS